MAIDVFNEIEKECEINLDWFYHSTYYDKENITSILTEGIKCGELLNSPGDSYNGPYYISLSKITTPDNECFAYEAAYKPTFIIEGIEPIKCVHNPLYYEFIKTKDQRRAGLKEEYQYYYFIKNIYIKGIVYNIFNLMENSYYGHQSLLNFLELISLLKELDMDLPIYDYSRREKTLAHTIDKERLKYYAKAIL